MSERVSLDAVANPGVATSDPCRLIRPNIGIQGTYVIEAVKMPMVSADGRMQLTCRERKVFA